MNQLAIDTIRSLSLCPIDDKIHIGPSFESGMYILDLPEALSDEIFLFALPLLSEVLDIPTIFEQYWYACDKAGGQLHLLQGGCMIMDIFSYVNTTKPSYCCLLFYPDENCLEEFTCLVFKKIAQSKWFFHSARLPEEKGDEFDSSMLLKQQRSESDLVYGLVQGQRYIWTQKGTESYPYVF